MEIILNRKIFVEALDKISSVIPQKPTITALSGILIESKENEVTITATDLENTIKITLPGKINKKGSILVPGKNFISLIRQLNQEEIRIFLKENQVNIQSEDSVYNFFVMNPEDFPKLPKFSGGASLKLDSSFLKTAIERIKFCIYPEEPRPHFRGGLLEINNQNFYLVGTDTRRLALVKGMLEGENNGKIRCLLPYRLLNLLAGILKEGPMEISVGTNQAFFKFNNTFLISQLLEGSADFPDYEKVVPEEKKLKTVSLEKGIFHTALKRISLFTSERYNKVKFHFGKDKLTITVSSPDIGEAQEKIPLTYTEEETSIAFNPDYMLEFLQNVDSEKIIIGFTSSAKPVLLRPENDTDYLYVAMPLRLD